MNEVLVRNSRVRCEESTVKGGECLHMRFINFPSSGVAYLVWVSLVNDKAGVASLGVREG